MKENKKKPAQSSRIFIIIWGFVMHIIFLWGVMDANFHSPIIQGLPVVPMPSGSPAKRILVFVADGLRFRTFKSFTPPYLNSIIKKGGVWGISHTRMPTESRPGNIAIVAGLYEDPSALFKGWKENPVDFDSVFNQSRASWLWGSPDIIPIFTKGNNHNIHGASYPASWQDFSNEPGATKRLDDWVFQEYSKWLANEAPAYKTEDKIIFYFHLLGCDTAGHAAKPQSKQYVDTMIQLDRNIKKVVDNTENYFGKHTTAYIFTSDHGMTDWGSHGSGSTDETETPFVAWGAGIAKDSNTIDIKQADITPLISALVGIPVPVNNEGVLHHELLDPKNDEFIANALLTNAKQLAEQIKANRELTTGRSIVNQFYKDKEYHEKLARAERILDKGATEKSITELEYVTKLSEEVLTYYRRYQTDRFLFCLMLMWVGWIALLFVDLSGLPRRTIQLGCYSWMLLANIALGVASIPLFIEYAVAGCKEWRLFGYGMICVISLWLAFRGIIKKGPTLEIDSNKPFIEALGIVFLTFMMFVGLIYRWTFSISMLVAVGLQKLIFDRNAPSWLLITGAALVVFPLLPVVGPQPRVYIVLIALGVSIVPIIRKRRIHNYNKVIEVIRIILTSLLCLNVIDGRAWLSWLLLLSTPLVISLYPKDWNQRIFGVTVALLSPLALLSASYEPIFFLIFATHIQHWPTFEFSQKSESGLRVLRLRNFSTAAFLMLYTLLCFFGTGNMASLSSFDPSWTRHFLTVFSPFTMASLILLKFVIPLILVGCLIRALAPDSTIFSAVLLLGDCLAIPLMYGVTNQGSWLDIGSAISRFAIAIVLPCLLLLVFYLTQPFTTFSLQDFLRRRAIKNQRLKI
ncbi:GPI ethanolamine phosphate transferase 1 isoform X1 [Nasonia vitripennis]|uniref:GPI ethanolamine phosphate transferase 1 n=1 Tax=Nasonia vitripennis TaxID=7425 RepID=A0A7M7H8X2_NASVI|nr:GPI ethanolamine phosphate transferase 1 isoform X1 [Nasonia vitripennis]